MDLAQAALLGVVEGLTEFLPVSSTAHLTIVEKLLGLRLDDPGVTAFTALIQVGAIVAVVLYFGRDILRLVQAWVRGLSSAEARGRPEYRLAWAILVGTVPIGLVGLLARHLVSGPLRDLWVVVAALIAWSVVMVAAEVLGRRRRTIATVTVSDGIVIGLVQCIALVPGVSRSGATISAGLFRGLDRVAATRVSFLLSIPALLAAGGFEAATSAGDVAGSVGWGPTAFAAAVSFVVALASIAWLLRLVARRPITVFVVYRIVLAVILAGLLVSGLLSPT